MSLYGPRIELPELPQLPEINLESIKKPLSIIAIIILILIIIYGMSIMFSGKGVNLFSNHLKVDWINNPLDLTKNGTYESQLIITLKNTTDKLTDITLDITTDSEELIIFCPYKVFPTVAPGNDRKATCIVRRDPKLAIFSGSYTIQIKTNLGETTTILNIVSN
jgi:hypothetical protein